MMDRKERISILEKWFAKTAELDSAVEKYLGVLGVDQTDLTSVVHEYIDINIILLSKATGIDEDWLLAYEEMVGTDVYIYQQQFNITDIPSFVDAVEADERGANAELENKP